MENSIVFLSRTCIVLILLFCESFLAVNAGIGDRARDECQKYGTQMVECQRKLLGVKTRVPADILEFPHMVMVGYKAPDESDDEILYQCGASLISPLWVLSAAHCLGDSRTGPPVRIRLGTTTLEAEEQEEDIIQERDIVKMVKHPNYKPPAKYNDIALIEMDSPIDLSGDIKIACLQVGPNLKTFKVKASGFGKTKFDNMDGSLTMMNVELDLVALEVCNKSFKSMARRGGSLKYGILPTQICAGDMENGGKDTCQGDSGGPLQYLPENPDCIKTFPLYVIVGVTSFGRLCGFRNSPGVYTRVSQFVDWIENIVWPIEKTPVSKMSGKKPTKLKHADKGNIDLEITTTQPDKDNETGINFEHVIENNANNDMMQSGNNSENEKNSTALTKEINKTTNKDDFNDELNKGKVTVTEVVPIDDENRMAPKTTSFRILNSNIKTTAINKNKTVPLAKTTPTTIKATRRQSHRNEEDTHDSSHTVSDDILEMPGFFDWINFTPTAKGRSSTTATTPKVEIHVDKLINKAKSWVTSWIAPRSNPKQFRFSN